MEELIIMGMNNIGVHKDGEENDTVLELTFYPPHSQPTQGVKVIISDFDMTKTFFIWFSLALRSKGKYTQQLQLTKSDLMRQYKRNDVAGIIGFPFVETQVFTTYTCTCRKKELGKNVTRSQVLSNQDFAKYYFQLTGRFVFS